jgi:heme exporter protein B
MRGRFLTQAVAIARRDLTIEGRAGEVLGVILPFAAVSVFVVPLATDALERRLTDLASPVYWLVGLLFGVIVSLRQTGAETLTQRRQLALSGLDPAARFAGRAAAAAILTLAVLAVTAPLVLLFYNIERVPRPGTMILVIVLFAIGLAMLSTLAGDVTTGLRTRTALAPLLVVPLAVPLFLGASQTYEAILRQGSTLMWVLLMVVFDLVLAAAGTIAAGPLEEAIT